MKAEELKEVFKQLCLEQKGRPNLLFCEFSDEKKECLFTMFLHSIKVELVYCWKWEALAAPSVLYCRFFLNKGDGLFIHLPELISFLGAEDYRACYFPYIENPGRMECCFRALMQIVDDYIPAAEELVRSGKADDLMRKWFQGNFFNPDDASGTVWNYDDPDDRQLLESVNRRFESIMVARHTTFDAYEAFLLKDWDKALKKYRKQEKSGLSTYEQGLCRFMEESGNRDFQPMPPACFALPEYKAFMGSGKDLLGMAMLWAPASAVMCGLIAVINGVIARGTVFHFGLPVWFGLIAAGLPAVFGYALFQPYILDWMRRRKDLEFHSMLDNHPAVNKFAAIVFAISVIGSLWLTVALTQDSARFYEDHAICTVEETQISFSYGQVEAIYYIRGRYNEYGGFVGRGSYVIVLQDGTCIDLDGYAGKRSQESLVQALFAEFNVILVDSDRDLPCFNRES